MEDKMTQIAIDGPAGSGKSTIAKKLANHLGLIYIDTGAMYRTLTLVALEKGIGADEDEKLAILLKDFPFHFEQISGKQAVFLGERDVSLEIRREGISQHVAQYAKNSLVREYLSNLQREMTKENAVIIDGRDIGTVILPQADFKFFLTASPEERAKRRTKELEEKGEKVDYQLILEDIIKRDTLDKKRTTSPLKRAEDAILIDTDNKNIEEVFHLILNDINQGKKSLE